MKHGIKKVKFTQGQDSHQALMRKLLVNFVKHGHIETTIKRGKALKAVVDRLVLKAKKGTEADKNVLMKHLNSKKMVDMMIKTIAPNFEQETGFVKVYRVGVRQGDAAEVVRMKWVKDLPAEVKEVKATVVEKTPATKKPVAKKAVTKKSAAK